MVYIQYFSEVYPEVDTHVDVSCTVDMVRYWMIKVPNVVDGRPTLSGQDSQHRQDHFFFRGFVPKGMVADGPYVYVDRSSDVPSPCETCDLSERVKHGSHLGCTVRGPLLYVVVVHSMYGCNTAPCVKTENDNWFCDSTP